MSSTEQSNEEQVIGFWSSSGAEELMNSFTEFSNFGSQEYQFVQQRDLSAELEQELNIHLQHAAKTGDFEPFLQTLNNNAPNKKEEIIFAVFFIFFGEILKTREFNLETLEKICLLQKPLINITHGTNSEVSKLSEQIESNRKDSEQRFSQIDQKLDSLIKSIGEMEGKLQATINERVPQDLGAKIISLPSIRTFWGGVVGGVIAGIGAIGVIFVILNSQIIANRSDFGTRISDLKTDLSNSDQQITNTLNNLQAELKRIEQKIPTN